MCENLLRICEFVENNDRTKSTSDVIRVVCRHCNRIEVCPSVTFDEFDTRALETGQGESV